MARIAEDELERIKRQVSVQRLVEAAGVVLKKHGADLHGRCPFHDDRTPSLVVSPKKNLWHCLGACQTGGSSIDWVMRERKVSFRLAVEILRRDIPSLAASSCAAAPAKLGPKLEPIAKGEEPDAIVLGRVVDYYHATLKESPEALAYLKQRGLVHPELIDRFRLGYSNRTLGYRLPAKVVKEGAVLRGQLQRLGIYRESGHEHFSGSLVIPIASESGEVLGLYGRKVGERLRDGTPMHLYLPGPHRGVFNAQALSASKEIILCEALLDALTFWCAGFRNVTSAYGIEGLTAEYWEAFEQHGIERVYVAYDRDDAGNRAAQKVCEELGKRGIEALRVLFPRGMDANEYALKVTPASASLGALLRGAQWIAGPSRRAAANTATRTQALEPSSAVTVSAAVEPEAAPAIASEADAVAVEADHSSLAASSAPQIAAPPAPPSAAAEVSEQEVVLRFGDRRWRVRGLEKNSSYERLKVNLHVSREGSGAFHVDTLELYSARHRGLYLKQAAIELGVEERFLKADMGSLLLELERLQDEQIKKLLEPKAQRVELSEAQRAEALELLRDPKLLERIASDFDRCGVVGEETNKLVLYLATVSRKLEAPLGVVIQSSSAAGKTSLMEAVLSLVPEEERVQYSAMTGQSLFYMGETDLSHKILAIAEEQGAQSASYALKLLQSEGELTIASTGKDPVSGRHITHEYRVQGPVMVMLTTTSIEVDEELLNRCLVLTVDEGREQTRAIQALQRHGRTLEGLVQKHERGRLMQLHQNAQRLLRPLSVVNPYAVELTFTDHAPRTRRDHMKYLGLIDAIALLHQYQRPVQTAQVGGGELRYIEVTREDIALADKLTAAVLARSLDELPPQTRRLLGLLHELVTLRATEQGVPREEVRFSRREVRDFSGFGHTQLKVHLGRLHDLEYVTLHAGGARTRMLYALCEYDANWSGSGRPVVGGRARPEKPSDHDGKAHLVGVNGTDRSAASAIDARRGRDRSAASL